MANSVFKKRIILENMLLLIILIFLVQSYQRGPSINYVLHSHRPTTAQGYHMRAKSFIASRKYKEAEQAAQKALVLDSKFAKAYIDLGNVYIETGNYIKAIKSFQKALGFVGNDKDNLEIIYYDLGIAHEREKDIDKSWEYYKKAYQMKSCLGSRFWKKDRSLPVYYVINNDNEGFKRVIGDDDSLPRELYKTDFRLQINLYLHRYKTIVDTCKKYIEDNPRSRYRYLFLEHLASAFLGMGEYSEITATLKELESLSLPPKDKDWIKKMHFYNLFRQQRYDEALQYLDSIDNTRDAQISENILRWKVLVYRSRNELIKEKVALNELLRKFPQSSYCVADRVQLSMIYLKLGDYLRSYDELVKSGFIPIMATLNIVSAIFISAILTGFFALIFRIFFKKRNLENRRSILFRKLDSFTFFILFFSIPWAMLLALLYLNHLFASFFKLLHINPVLTANILSQSILAGICLFFLKNKYKLDNANIGFISRGYKFNIILPLFVTIASILILIAFVALISMLGVEKPPPSQLKYIVYNVIKERSLTQLVFLFITGVIVVPIAEEIIFRGYFMNFFKRHTNIGFAVAASTFLFAFSHETLLFAPYFIFMGIVLSLIYVKTKTIIPCIVTHALYNLIVMSFGVIIYFLKS